MLITSCCVICIPSSWLVLNEECQQLCSSCSVTVSLSSRSGKVIIIGAPGVGKTSLLLRWVFVSCMVKWMPLAGVLVSRYCQHVFESHYKNTIGVDFEVERYKILGQPFCLQLWVVSPTNTIEYKYLTLMHLQLVEIPWHDPPRSAYYKPIAGLLFSFSVSNFCVHLMIAGHS